MRVIETRGTVTADGELLVRVRAPEGAAPVPHRVVVVIEDLPPAGRQPQPLHLPLLPVESWPADLSLRREDLYGDWGR